MTTDSVPLSPVQRRFFEQPLTNRGHFHQARMLRLAGQLPVGLVAQAWSRVVESHEVFGLRFEPTQWGWTQRQVGARDALAVRVVSGDLVAACASAQRCLDIRFGPVIAVLLSPASGKITRCLVVAHHLFVDLLSWRVLVEDVDRWCCYLGGTGPRPVGARAGFATWCRTLAEHGRRAEVLAEVGHWRDVLVDTAPPPAAKPPAGAAAVVQRPLPIALAKGLREAPRRFRLPAGELALAAFGMALRAELGHPVAIDVEAHGRESIPGAPPLARAVGWFTSPTPYRFAATTWQDALDEATIARRLPYGGLHFGVLRFMATRGRTELVGLPLPWVSYDFRAERHTHPAGNRLVGIVDAPVGSLTDVRDGPWYDLSAEVAMQPDAALLRLEHRIGTVSSGMAERILDGWVAALTASVRDG